LKKKSKRGRPLAISPYDYVTIFILSSLSDLSLRNDEFLSDLLAGKHIDHSTFGKEFAKTPYMYLKKLLIMTRNVIGNHVETDSILIVDPTWVKVDRVYYDTMTKCHYGKRRMRDKMNILTEYYQDEGIFGGLECRRYIIH